MHGIRVKAGLAMLALVAGPALAETTTMRRPIEAGSLYEGPLDMVAYYRRAADGALEVTATFAPDVPAVAGDPAVPMRIVMALGDGDDVAFAMPGYPQALYRFARAGQRVTAEVRQVDPTAIDPRRRVASAR